MKETSIFAISEKKLHDIGSAVGSEGTKVEKLGLALDLKYSDIQNYKNENEKGNSTEGTVHMLFDWKLGTKIADQRPKLKGALRNAGLAEIIDVYLSGSSTPSCKDIESNQVDDATSIQCLQCDRELGKLGSVFNDKECNNAVKTRYGSLFGKNCFIQVEETMGGDRVEVVTLRGASVKIDKKENNWNNYDGFPVHQCIRCEGCSKQVGWYNKPSEENKDGGFYELWLQKILSGPYEAPVKITETVDVIMLTRLISRLAY